MRFGNWLKRAMAEAEIFQNRKPKTSNWWMATSNLPQQLATTPTSQLQYKQTRSLPQAGNLAHWLSAQWHATAVTTCLDNSSDMFTSLFFFLFLCHVSDSCSLQFGGQWKWKRSAALVSGKTHISLSHSLSRLKCKSEELLKAYNLKDETNRINILKNITNKKYIC